jgi:hypothetical protein
VISGTRRQVVDFFFVPKKRFHAHDQEGAQTIHHLMMYFSGDFDLRSQIYSANRSGNQEMAHSTA